MVLVPADTAVTNPELSTAATEAVEDTQGKLAAAVAEPVNCEVDPIHADKVPVTVGNGLTVNTDGT